MIKMPKTSKRGLGSNNQEHLLEEQTQSFAWTAADFVEGFPAQKAEQEAIEFIGSE